MTWKEAISRSLRALVAFLIVYVSGIAAIGLGAALIVIGASSNTWVLSLPAIVLYIIGLFIMIIGGFAVMLKLITDAVVDHVTERLAGGQTEE